MQSTHVVPNEAAGNCLRDTVCTKARGGLVEGLLANRFSRMEVKPRVPLPRASGSCGKGAEWTAAWTTGVRVPPNNNLAQLQAEKPFAGKRYTHPANGRQRCNHRLNFLMRDDYKCVA